MDLSAAESPPFAAPVDAATGETIACPVIDLSLEGTDFDVPTTARRLGSDAHVDAHPDYDTPRRVALDAPVWYMKSHEGEESHAHRREHEKRLLQVSGTSSKTCLFVHGGAGDQRRLATSTYDDYWGEVHQYVNDACEPKFLHLPMRDSAWDSPSLAIDFCDDAAGGHTGQAITDTLVFAHGAGSNVVISALAQGRCTLDASSALVNVAATNYGAQMAVSSFANDVCRKRGNHALKVRSNLKSCRAAVQQLGLATRPCTPEPCDDTDSHTCCDAASCVHPITPSLRVASARRAPGRARCSRPTVRVT